MMNIEKLDKWLERIRNEYRKKNDTIKETELRLQFFNARVLLEIIRELDKSKRRSPK